MSALWVSAGTTARTAPYAMGPSAAVQPLQPPVGLPGVPAAQPPQLTGSATALTPPSASFGEGSEVPLPEVLEPQAADASSEPDIVVDFLKLLTPAMYAVLSIGAVWQMWRHQTQSSQWAAAGLAAEPNRTADATSPVPLSPAVPLAAEHDPNEPLQLRMASGRRSNYGRQKKNPLEIVWSRIAAFGRGIVNFFNGFVRWVRNHPIDVVMILIFLCSWALWLNPSLEPVFLVQGFRNPLAFIFSGFTCFNIYQLYSDIFYVYILGKAYMYNYSPNELAFLFFGGTFMGSLLVALGPGGWMGPTAGTASLLTAFMLQYPGTPMAIPMIPLIFFPFQVRWIGTVLAAANFYLFSKGVASGASFTGGVLFALLVKRRKAMQTQAVSLC
jgi:hypothetical protein